MRRPIFTAPFIILALIISLLAGCSGLNGPETTGQINLSSRLYGTESYYLFGYSYEESELYKYPGSGETLPDIINEGFMVIEGGSKWAEPGFNTPENVNGFSLAGSFSSSGEARAFFEDYLKVEEDLNFVVASDTVKENQVWVQKTASGNYVKLLVRTITSYEVDQGRPYSDVLLEYVYQPDGSDTFPE